MKYEMRICKCGRIHMISMEKVSTALEADKNLLFVCGSCGAATLIGADIEPDWDEPDKNCYNMYSYDFSNYEDASISVSDFDSTENKKGISEVFYSHGIKVPMMTGEYARSYLSGRFSDMWYPDFYKIQRKDITVEEIMMFIDEFTHNRTTVNMSRFIHDTPEDMLDEISSYWIYGFNWKGTKWENKK